MATIEQPLKTMAMTGAEYLESLRDNRTVYFHGEKWVAYGEEKMRMMFAHRSFLDYGIPAAAASDFTPAPYEPMMALQSMVFNLSRIVRWLVSDGGQCTQEGLLLGWHRHHLGDLGQQSFPEFGDLPDHGFVRSGVLGDLPALRFHIRDSFPYGVYG